MLLCFFFALSHAQSNKKSLITWMRVCIWPYGTTNCLIILKYVIKQVKEKFSLFEIKKLMVKFNFTFLVMFSLSLETNRQHYSFHMKTTMKQKCLLIFFVISFCSWSQLLESLPLPNVSTIFLDIFYLLYLRIYLYHSCCS